MCFFNVENSDFALNSIKYSSYATVHFKALWLIKGKEKYLILYGRLFSTSKYLIK